MSGPSLVEDIFLAALEKGTLMERAAYLNAACKDDLDLRRRVERLLEAHPRASGFLEGPARPAGEETAACVPIGEQVGAVIAGRYKLLEQIGEGGMGTVWVAEQTQPVRRKVALKLIKPGMDSRTVVSRFEAERQALALMDHPNIAKVLDGGTTEGGRPFFVMEYVKGVPFNRYCDDARLSVAQRLALFMPICQAVQHAHQKGIIHRDLKPSNILVCLYDGVPVPKVIDFGLAKAMHQPLTEHTLHTAHGVMMGTPLYMSPEQAEFNNLDVDTRTDIYALGVILYELLTGTTPLEKQRFKEAAWHEMLRLIKEEEPQRPSARLSGSGSLPSLAAQRQLEPVKLTKLVRGELDWIVMKCLEKDRSRRYETASGLARDLEHYLHDEMVEARPASAGYRLRKFARKNRVALVTTAAFAGLLIAAAAVSSWLAITAMRAEGIANQNEAAARAAEKDAEEKRREAQANLDDAKRAKIETVVEKLKSDLNGLSLQIDLDMMEFKSDARVGLLRLASPRKGRGRPIPVTGILENGEVMDGFTLSIETLPEYGTLREFVTMAVLAAGQRFVPLLPPITHDGALVRYSSLSSKGDRFLTRGADNTARLWDPFTGRQIALLRRADEKVLDAGLSPDGTTAFTHSLDGVVRLWETKDGAFRAATEPRPQRIRFSRDAISVPFLESASWVYPYDSNWRPINDVNKLSNDRLLTRGKVWNEGKNNSGGWTYDSGPVELWDARTGRFIAQLETPESDMLDLGFFGNGRWLGTTFSFARDTVLRVFSAENGQLAAKITPDKKYGWPGPELIGSPSGNPSGNTAATISEVGQNPNAFYVHVWDTKSWKVLSTTGPLKWGSRERAYFELIADDLFTMTQLDGTIGVFRAGAATPIADLSGSVERFLGDRVLLDSGQVFDTRTWRRLQPPKGRKYHPDITRFAPDSRFVPLSNVNNRWVDVPPDLIDTKTEKAGAVALRTPCYEARHGWVGWVENGFEIALHRLPPPDRLNLPPDLLELWAQVAVRGELGPEGEFVKWNEPTWEKKREELAAKPAPYPDFPFPGRVATDRLHWLRQEYESASDANKPGLAKQLLDRAEATGDKAEVVHWRAILTPKPSPTKPAVKP
jgi:eukaryotic-like serine/threonine-protein kinase